MMKASTGGPGIRPRTILIMQARLASTRLPGKVMLQVLPGRTMLDLTIERLKQCQWIDKIVVAVPDSAKDDPVAQEAERCGVAVFRGPEEDVLSRYLACARAHGAEIVVRVTSDCPLIDPLVIDLHVRHLVDAWNRTDFVTNMATQTFPLGLAVEAMPLDTLVRMDRLSPDPVLREHVTTLAYERPELFLIQPVLDDTDRSSLRWTVDYLEDLQFVKRVYQALYRSGIPFSTLEILRWLETHPSESRTISEVKK